VSARPYTSPFLLPGRAVTVVILVAALLPAATSFAWTPQPVAGDALVRLPGTQPGTVALEGPDRCLNCHLGYDGGTAEPGHWQGSMMAQSARDFLFWATLVVAAQDSIWAAGRPNATDLCLRCHFPEGWLGSRSDPTDGSLMTGSDFDGVSLLPEGLEDVSTYPAITQELLDRGYSEADIKKILGGNALRVLREAEEVARRLSAG